MVPVKALVVYDSVFGNAEKVAQAIGGALGTEAEVLAIRVGDVEPHQMIGLNGVNKGYAVRPAPLQRRGL